MCLHRKLHATFLKSGITSEKKPAWRSRIESRLRSCKVQLSSLKILAQDITEQKVKFFPVYSYLIVYRPDTKPLQIASIIHGRRDLETLLRNRL
jgi:hypothetical protein